VLVRSHTLQKFILLLLLLLLLLHHCLLYAGSHTHIPGTNHVPRGYNVAAILSLLFMVPIIIIIIIICGFALRV